ncbi:AMIN-like domain-containing (lipo)protein [Streptomyces tsukubensis]|uniref:AMIN-like domain-containing (lipo)protein n=1 Tax=Streptomyces tsukubensis TaxID=83656 RepID=UPI0036AA312B
MRTVGRAATALALAGITLVGSAGAAWASCGQVDHPVAAAVCSAPWGSGTEASAESVTEPLKNIRTGRHDCYDRIVFDITGAAAETGYQVGYVSAFYQDGTGRRIPVTGGAVLQIHVNAPSYNPSTGTVVYPGRPGQPLPGVDIAGYSTFKDTKYGSSYEGRTQVAVGVRAKLPFRVLQYGDRVVVDVAHTW